MRVESVRHRHLVLIYIELACNLILKGNCNFWLVVVILFFYKLCLATLFLDPTTVEIRNSISLKATLGTELIIDE